MTRWQQLTVLLAGAALVAAGSVAWAANSHTVGEWYHGLGDGQDNDYFLHPNNDSTYNHAHLSNTVRLWNGSTGTRWDNVCICEHSHMDRDTSPTRECKFFSGHSTGGRAWGTSTHSNGGALNYNQHLHHYECIA